MCARRFFLVFLFTAVLLTASDNALADKYRLGKEIQITICDGDPPLRDHTSPAVAYNRHQKEYLVVESSEHRYSHWHQISAYRVSPNGSKTDLGIVSTGSSCTSPDVAYDPQNGRYLIVWEQYNFDTSRREIYGRIIPWNSLGTNEPFVIAAYSNSSLMFPAVAFGYNHQTGSYHYIVVCSASGTLEGIVYNLVSVDGSPRIWLDVIDSAPGPLYSFSDISFNMATAEFLVVWEKNGGDSGMDIYGVRLNMDGHLQGAIFPINSATHDDLRPAVTTNTQHRYLVAWQHDYGGSNTDWDIRGQFLDASGGKVGGVQSIAITVDNEKYPALAASGGIEEYLAVWQKRTEFRHGILGRLLYTDFSALGSFEIAPPGGGYNEYPAAGCHNSGYLVTYSRDPLDPTIYGDIYGRMLLEPRVVNPGLWLLLLGN
jgi:hypothetical protein